jgi:hypothetical protein
MSDLKADGVHVGGDEALLSVTVRELCNQLRANDTQVLTSHFSFFNSMAQYSVAEWIAVFQALKENTSVKSIDWSMRFQPHGRSALVAAAEYLESSKTLQTIDLSFSLSEDSHAVREMTSFVLRALSRNRSVTKLVISSQNVRFATAAFQDLLTCTQTLQKLEMKGSRNGAYDEAQIAAIASAFANNTTLREQLARRRPGPSVDSLTGPSGASKDPFQCDVFASPP